MNALTARCALPTPARLGEGALWDSASERLLWVDILGHRVHRFDPESGADESFDVGQDVGTVVARREGGLMVALREGIATLDFDRSALEIVARPPAAEHPPGNRFNDGKCDPAGRLWAGTMHESASVAGAGQLYCLGPDRSLERKLGGVTVSNGLAWSHSGKTLFFIDSPTFEVAAFDFDVATGGLGRRRTAVKIDRAMGVPDGMTIDVEGMLWVAHWDGWCVRRWNPATGKPVAEIRLPAAQVTSCAFGGPRLDRLYITSAAVGLSDEQRAAQPLAGSVFVCENPGATGVPAFAFAG